MGLVGALIFGLVAFLFYKAPVDVYWPLPPWGKSEEEARESQQEVKRGCVLFAGGIAFLLLGLQLIVWFTGGKG